MPAERFDLPDRVFRFLRFPVAQMNKGRNRRGIGKGKHLRIIVPEQALVHHAGEYMGEHICETGQEVLCCQFPRTHIPELLKHQHLARHHNLLVMDRKVHHSHGHIHQSLQGIRHRQQVLRRTEMFSVISDHLIQQRIPNSFLALIVFIDPGLDKPK